MPKEEINLNQLCREYMFARLVNVYNYGVIRDNDNVNNEHLITSTLGRKMHRLALKNLNEFNKGEEEVHFGNVSVLTFFKAVNKAAVSTIGKEIVDESIAIPYHKRFVDVFSEITGFLSTPEAKEQRSQGILPEEGYIPISPFDPRFSHRSIILDHGTEILYVPLNDYVESVPMTINGKEVFTICYKYGPGEEFGKGIHCYSRTEDVASYIDQGEFYTIDDKYGTAALKPYMSEHDYNNIRPWMKIDDVDRPSVDAMDKGVDILKNLQKRGIPYTVTKDRYPGQLKADISNTKISIRIADIKDNERFLGRVYKDGYALYIDGTIYNKEDKSRTKYIPKSKEIETLLAYALGESPKRLNTKSELFGYTVGSPATMRLGKNGQDVRLSYMFEGKNGPSIQTMLGFSKDYKKDPNPNEPSVLLNIRSSNNHSDRHIIFESDEEAEHFLKKAVMSARDRFRQDVDIDRLIAEYEEYKDDDSYTPLFSGDEAIAPIQQIYWDVLSGRHELYKASDIDHNPILKDSCEALGLISESEMEKLEGELDVDDGVVDMSGEKYSGTPVENVRQHLEDSIDLMFGNYEPDANGLRFNFSTVSTFMDSAYGIYRNNDNLIAAMRKLGFDSDEIRGNDFQTGLAKDALIKFDEESAKEMQYSSSDYLAAVYESIKAAIQGTACRVDEHDILIDKNGIVRYTAYQYVGSKVNANGFQKIEGQIGQIFVPDAQGVVETKYNGSANKLFTPGYNAYILPFDENSNARGDLMRRVRLSGLLQTVRRNVAETIRYDLIGAGAPLHNSITGEIIGKSVGSPVNINHSYKGLYGTSYKINIKALEGETLKDTYLRQAKMTHLGADILNARFETAKGLLHFSKEVANGSTVSAAYLHNKMGDPFGRKKYKIANDNFVDMYHLTGRTNMAITAKHSEGFTDAVLTGSGTNQGIIRYLASGAKVEPSGRIDRSPDLNDRAPLMLTSPMRYCDYIPADRVQMVGSNYLTASGIAGLEERKISDGTTISGVGVAQITLQGFTFDDGAVISSDFANKYQVIGENGELRSLKPGDKICDFAGNKSIVAKVIDRNMDLDEAKEKGVLASVKLFKNNPDLDIVQSPYSAVSRFNAASAKLLMETPKDLVLPDGTIKEGCLGFAPMIITHHTAHEHTKQYSEEDIKVGKGRKISAQLAWALCAKNATHIMDEVYAGNNGTVMNMREYLHIMGLDMSETGQLRKGFQPHNGEKRNIFELPGEDIIDNIDMRDVGELFKEHVSRRGGFLKLPFEITLPSGVETNLLPVMSSHLRSGRTFDDGTIQIHDYTNNYIQIFKSAIDYVRAEKQGDATAKALARGQVEFTYNAISESVRTRKFETKKNIVRDELMARRAPHSATAVWTPDTNLNLNEIAMSGNMMKHLGVKEGDYTLIWRDPILRDYGAKYVKVVRNDELTGVAVNPLIAMSMDGDFDGDSIGIHTLSRKDSKQEAFEKFSFEYNILDTTKRGRCGRFALIINDGMDVISAEVADEQRKAQAIANGEDYGPTLKERHMMLEKKANELYKNDASKEERVEFINELSKWAKDCLCDTCGTEVISYKDVQSHGRTLIDMVDHGAKGSHKKLGDYFKYFGATFEKDENEHIIAESLKDVGHTLATREDLVDAELATAIKSHGTGNAGAVSQRLVCCLRNICASVDGKTERKYKETALSAGLQLTYLATQGILQAKRDPIQAQKLYENLLGPIRHLWRGREIWRDVEIGEWKPQTMTGPNGKPVYVQATRKDWVRDFFDIHVDVDGLALDNDINCDHIKQVADMLTDQKSGRMLDIEDDEVIYKYAAPMDILAYNHTDSFKTLCRMADDGRNIFEGGYSQHFAPRQIRDNIEREKKGEPLMPIAPIDVLENYDITLRKMVSDDVNTSIDYSSVVINSTVKESKIQEEEVSDSVPNDVQRETFVGVDNGENHIDNNYDEYPEQLSMFDVDYSKNVSQPLKETSQSVTVNTVSHTAGATRVRQKAKDDGEFSL